jgi:hypothetical protein
VVPAAAAKDKNEGFDIALESKALELDWLDTGEISALKCCY